MLFKPIWRIIKKYKISKKRIFLEPSKIKLRAMKDLYKGKHCFLIGNGPSLNEMDLTKLKNEITFGVNAIFLNFHKMNFSPTFYSVEDVFVAEDRAYEINRLDGMTKFFPIDLSYCLENLSGTIYINFIRNHKYFPSFSKDCSEKVFWGSTVTYMNMQIAYYMGFTTLYLIGMDFSYKIPDYITGSDIISQEDDVSHFHPDYFGKGYRWHHPRLDRVIMAYKVAKEEFEKDGRKIINATKGGQLNLFERQRYEDIFK